MLLSRIVRAFHMTTIRSRLLAAFALTVPLPAIAYITLSSAVGYRSGRQQVIDQLESVATIKEAELNTWVSSLQSDLDSALIGEEMVLYVRQILSPSPDPMDYQVAYTQLHDRFGQMVEQSQRLEGLFLMNLQRRVVLSTDPRQEGAFGAPGSHVYFREGLKGEYLHPPSYSLSVGGIAVVAVRPILDDQGQVLGILAGRAGQRSLSEIMLERTGLGKTGETYLVTRSHIMLTEPRFRKERWSNVYYVFSEGADAAVIYHASGSGSYNNYLGVRVIGVYHWLPELQAALLAEQAESEAMSAVYTTLRLNIAVTLVAMLIASLISVVLAQSIAVPLADLVETAARVAGGDLEYVAAVEVVGEAADGFEAVLEARSRQPDVILMDLVEIRLSRSRLASIRA
ncbi:MAG: hypothetical protein ACE5LU_12915 [Anaerolineae bacterium]